MKNTYSFWSVIRASTLFVYFTFFVALSALYSQRAQLDSLLKELEKPMSDSLKCDLMGWTAGFYWSYNLDSAKYLLDKSMELCRKVNYKEKIYKNYYRYATTYYYAGEIDSTLSYIEKGISAMSSFDDPQYKAGFLNLKAQVHENTGDFEKSIEANLEAARLFESMGDSINTYSQYNNLASIYKRILDFETGNKYARKAIRGFRKYNDSLSLAIALVTLSRQPSADTSTRFASDIDEAIFIANKFNATAVLGLAYINKGALLYGKGLYDEALPIYEKAHQYNLQSGHTVQYLFSKRILGEIYSLQGNKQLGEDLLNETLSEAIKYSNFENIKGAKLELFHHHTRFGEHKKANDFLTEYVEIIDSSYRHELAIQAQNAQEKFQSEKKEKQIAEQRLEIARQSNARSRTLFGGIAALLLASFIFTWYYQRQKRKKQEAELALKLEKSEADNLRHLDELKSNFFTNLSHELRTPLTLIMGPLENAKENAAEIAVKKEIDLAHKNASKLHGLVNEIMDLSKLEAGKLEMSNRQLPFIPLLRRIFFSFESLAAMRNIKLVFTNNLNADYLINTDLKRFEKVLNNLISNAIKFSNNNDSIQLIVDKNSQHIFFHVVDSGKGIHPDDLPYVFDRFYQTSKTGHLDGGTGIGLAYAKEIVKRFNGQLSVKSSVNKGSTFTCSLPIDSFQVLDQKDDIIVPTTNAPQTKNDYVPITINGQKPKILIVEDNPDMQDYLQQIMSPFYSCVVANDGIHALQKLKERNFDLITSDVMMPRMDGFEFKTKVDENNQASSIPFIMLTARSMEEDKLRGLRLGVDDYLTKPFSSDELLTRMSNLLVNKKQRDEFINSEESDDISNLNAEQSILKRAEDFIQKNIDSFDLSVPLLAKDLGYSQRQVTRVLKKLTGLTPVSFILEIRLQKARYLLESKSFLSVDEVRYEIGIESASYFSRKFKDRFGKNPSEYLS